ncbi:DMT family transporter [Cohnella sp. GCM10012308]|uniref:DMT family transporter n=1 Tax=Cohnella sp. GCM10012308 TaxID=3317329 RepID=UPI00360636A6
MVGYAVVLGAVFIWGVSYIVMKEATTDYPHVLFQFWRYAAVSLIYLAWSYRSLRSIPAKVWRAGLFGLGLANFTLGIFSIFAVQYTTPTRVVVINSFIIAVVPLLRWIHDKARPERHEKWAIGIALVAIALLIDPRDGGLKPGDGLALLGMIGYAYSIVLTNRLLLRDRASVVQVSMLGIVGCSAYFSVAGIVYACLRPEGFGLKLLVSQPGTLTGILFMILFVSLAANLLQVFGQRKLPPVTVSILFCLEPAVTALLDYVLLGNPPSLRMALCGTLLISATLVVALRGLTGLPRKRDAGTGRRARSAAGDKRGESPPL